MWNFCRIPLTIRYWKFTAGGVEIKMLKNIIESFGEKEKVVNFSAKTKERVGAQGAKEISESANWPNMTTFNISKRWARRRHERCRR